MSKRSINFLHLGDTHFGVHYAVKPKNLQRRAYGEAFFQKAEEVLHTAISKHQVDFILHAGDFFNRSKPPPEVVDRGVQPFLYAANQGVPVYLLPGNHERSKLPLGLLSYYENINLFVKPSAFCFEKQGMRIKITGVPYIRRHAQTQFGTILRQAWDNYMDKDLTPHHYSILVTHQLIEGSRIESYTFQRGSNVLSFQQIPKKFNYVACGHVHRFQFLYRFPRLVGDTYKVQSTNKHYSIHQDCSNQVWRFNKGQTSPSTHYNDPIFAYSGSLERVSMTERYEPKGYIIGKLYFSEHDDTIQTAVYSFHSLPALEMVYWIWDLSRTTIQEYVDQALEKLYSIGSARPSLLNEEKGTLSAVFRIRVKGTHKFSTKNLELLKQEAKRLNIYLTFSFPQKDKN